MADVLIHRANYDTNKSDDIFTPIGTHSYNIRIYGDDIRLKSWFGSKNSIAVNCNGYANEGVYPEDSQMILKTILYWQKQLNRVSVFT